MDEHKNAGEREVEMVTGAECSGTLDIRALTAPSDELRVSRPTLDLVLSIGSPRPPEGVATSGATRARVGVWQVAGGILGGAALFALGALAGHGARVEVGALDTRVASAALEEIRAGAPIAGRDDKAMRPGEPQAVAAAPSAEVPAAVVAEAPDERAAARRPRSGALSTAPSSSTRATTTVPASNRTSDRRGAGAPTLDELLHRATTTSSPSAPVVPAVLPSGPTAGAMPSPPATPTRAQVREAMDAIAPAIRACAEGSHGQALLTLVFSGETGRVRSATVSGGYAGTPAGSCIARAARGAELAPFSRATFTIAYPFAL